MENKMSIQYSMVYKDEVEIVAKKLKSAIYELENLGDRYHNGRPIQIQDASRHARVAHDRIMNLRDHTVTRE